MKGLIVGGGDTEPLYQVKLIHDTTWHDAEVAKANKLIATADARIAEQQLIHTNAVIELSQMPQASLEARAIVQDKIDVSANKLSRYKLIRKIALDRVSTLERIKVPDTTVDAWCADYTTGLSGEVAICEQMLAGGAKRYTIYAAAKDSTATNQMFVDDANGKLADAQKRVADLEAQKTSNEHTLQYMKSLYALQEPPKDDSGVQWAFMRLSQTLGKLELAKKVVANVQRGIDMVNAYTGRTAAYDALLDGRQVETATMPPRTWFINAAREPWRYMWKPRYVKGAVTAVDTNANTLDVAVEQVTFGLNKELIHTKLKTTAIPANYMGMGAELYQNGDEVLVEFPSFNPQLPVVNGFSINPRPPYLWAESLYQAIDYANEIAYCYKEWRKDPNNIYDTINTIAVYDTRNARTIGNITVRDSEVAAALARTYGGIRGVGAYDGGIYLIDYLGTFVTRVEYTVVLSQDRKTIVSAFMGSDVSIYAQQDGGNAYYTYQRLPDLTYKIARNLEAGALSLENGLQSYTTKVWFDRLGKVSTDLFESIVGVYSADSTSSKPRLSSAWIFCKSTDALAVPTNDGRYVKAVTPPQA